MSLQKYLVFPVLIIVFSILYFFYDYNEFENQFYESITAKKEEFFSQHEPVRFHLGEITDFDWDSVLYVPGNESVPVLAEEIELILNKKTTDLDTYKDRFYFLKDGEIVFETDISASGRSGYPSFSWKLCKENNQIDWLSYNQCDFKVIPNAFSMNNSILFFFPTCRAIPKAFLARMSSPPKTSN